MKSRTMVAVILSILMIAVPAMGAMEQPMNQNQVQDRDRVQTNINEVEQEQIRLEINNRLRIDGSALEQMKLREQEQTQNRFMDLENHWSRDEVGQSYNWGFVNGYPDGSFRPEGIISGTEGILMLTRMMNAVATGMPGEPDPEDVDWDRVPEWARDQLREGIALTIATQSHLYGESQLNRLQFAVMMAKAMGIEAGMPPVDTVVFLDDEGIPPAELGYIYRLRALGIIQGNEGNFMPQKRLTRAEAAAMMNRVMMMLKIAPTEYSYEPDMLTVVLHENPTTGYGWVVEFEEGDILKIESDEFVPFAVSADVVGSGGERTWIFTPEKSGTEEITFIYYRSWESKDMAIETRALTVEVDDNLEIIDVR
ncbi:protease inhibitor I42 family protein [Gudongella sp. DL1XJH-153]|uniref:protease inhibitor I42 family protein n=1 Tax=Gudongella sp. DL1XJH-153 TaxID=3409804 RepID=UPI003BB7C2B1